eukprot:1291384-Amphidinium_carterae.1
MVEHVAASTGLSLHRSDGLPRFTGYTMRVSGAQWLSKLGLEVSLIALFGRWNSNAIWRYLRDSPLQDSKDWLAKECRLCDTSGSMPCVGVPATPVTRRMGSPATPRSARGDWRGSAKHESLAELHKCAVQALEKRQTDLARNQLNTGEDVKGVWVKVSELAQAVEDLTASIANKTCNGRSSSSSELTL